MVVAAHYLLSGNFHPVVGDRALPSSSYELNVGLRRQAASRLFSTVVGTLVTGGFFDTQCGFKAIRGDVAELLIPVARIDRLPSTWSCSIWRSITDSTSRGSRCSFANETSACDWSVILFARSSTWGVSSTTNCVGGTNAPVCTRWCRMNSPASARTRTSHRRPLASVETSKSRRNRASGALSRVNVEGGQSPAIGRRGRRF